MTCRWKARSRVEVDDVAHHGGAPLHSEILETR